MGFMDLFKSRRVKKLEAELALTKEKLLRSDDVIDAYMRENQALTATKKQVQDLELLIKCLKMSMPDGLLDEAEFMLEEYLLKFQKEKEAARDYMEKAKKHQRTCVTSVNNLRASKAFHTGF